MGANRHRRTRGASNPRVVAQRRRIPDPGAGNDVHGRAVVERVIRVRRGRPVPAATTHGCGNTSRQPRRDPRCRRRPQNVSNIPARIALIAPDGRILIDPIDGSPELIMPSTDPGSGAAGASRWWPEAAPGGEFNLQDIATIQGADWVLATTEPGSCDSGCVVQLVLAPLDEPKGRAVTLDLDVSASPQPPAGYPPSVPVGARPTGRCRSRRFGSGLASASRALGPWVSRVLGLVGVRGGRSSRW